MSPLSASARLRWRSVTVTVAVLACLGGAATTALGHHPGMGLVSAVLTGLCVGVFEEFFVRGSGGRWVRTGPAVASGLTYISCVAAFCALSLCMPRMIFGHGSGLEARLVPVPGKLPLLITYALAGIVTTRFVSFVGADAFPHLVFGIYNRPVMVRKVILFLDMDGSTAHAERLGAFRMQEFLCRFLDDVSRPISDRRGSIYLYKGDGLIAAWDWDAAIRTGAVLDAVDAMFARVERAAAAYAREFGAVPSFRVGIHGGDVVLRETGTVKRTIGIYGEDINIAARMEDACRAHGIACSVSGAVVDGLGDARRGLDFVGSDTFRGMGKPTDVYAYRGPRCAPFAPRVSDKLRTA